MKFQLFIFCCLLNLSTISFAASYDCGLSGLSNIEESICSNARLSALDELLSDWYAKIKSESSSEERDLLLKTQRSWIKDRNRCSSTAFPKTCLFESYSERILVLKGLYFVDKKNRKSCLYKTTPMEFFSCYYLSDANEYEFATSVFKQLAGFDYGLDGLPEDLESYINDACRIPQGNILEDYSSIECFVRSKRQLANQISERLINNSKDSKYSKVTSIDEYSMPVDDAPVLEVVSNLIQSGDSEVGCEGRTPDINSLLLLDSELYGAGIYYAGYSCGASYRVAILEVTSGYSEILGTYDYNYCYRNCDGYDSVSAYINDFNGDRMPDILFVEPNNSTVVAAFGSGKSNKYFNQWSARVANFPEEYGYRENIQPLVALSEYTIARTKMVWPFNARSHEPSSKHKILVGQTLSPINTTPPQRIKYLQDKPYSFSFIQGTDLFVQEFHGNLLTTNLKTNERHVTPIKFTHHHSISQNGRFLTYSVLSSGEVSYWVHDILFDSTYEIPKKRKYYGEFDHYDSIVTNSTGAISAFEWRTDNVFSVFFYDKLSDDLIEIASRASGPKISDDGNFVAFCDYKEGIKIWSRQTKNIELVIPLDFISEAITPCEKKVYEISSNGQYVIRTTGNEWKPVIGGLDFDAHAGSFETVRNFTFHYRKPQYHSPDKYLHYVETSSGVYEYVLIDWANHESPKLEKRWTDIYALSANPDKSIFASIENSQIQKLSGFNGVKITDESQAKSLSYSLHYKTEQPSRDIVWDSAVAMNLKSLDQQWNVGYWLESVVGSQTPEYKLSDSNIELIGSLNSVTFPYFPLGVLDTSTNLWRFSEQVLSSEETKKFLDGFDIFSGYDQSKINLDESVVWEVSLLLSKWMGKGYVLHFNESDTNLLSFVFLQTEPPINSE